MTVSGHWHLADVLCVCRLTLDTEGKMFLEGQETHSDVSLNRAGALFHHD